MSALPPTRRPAGTPAAESTTPSRPCPDPNGAGGVPPATSPRELPASRGCRDAALPPDMTPGQIAAIVNAALDTRGVGRRPLPASTLNSAGAPWTTPTSARAPPPMPTPPARIQAPAGADLHRARVVEDVILKHRTHSPDSAAAIFGAEVLRNVTFGTDAVEHVGVSSYREPSGRQQKALWLGLSHNMRSHGLTGLADWPSAAPVLGVDIKGCAA